MKRRVMAEAAAPHRYSVAIARRYDLIASILFNWKRRYGVSDRLLPVEISAPPLGTPRTSDEPMDSSDSGATSIEVPLANGHRPRQLHANTGFAEGSGTPVSDHATGKVGEDRCERGQPRSVRRVPVSWRGGAEELVPEFLEPDR